MKKNSKKAESYSSELIKNLLSELSPEEHNRTKQKMMLAARIDDAIKAKGWKKKDLAEALNKKSSVITKWLSGTHNFTADTLWDIEKVLNIELISITVHKSEQVTNFYITVSQKADKKSSDCMILNDIDELIPYFSTNIKA